MQRRKENLLTVLLLISEFIYNPLTENFPFFIPLFDSLSPDAGAVAPRSNII